MTFPLTGTKTVIREECTASCLHFARDRPARSAQTRRDADIIESSSVSWLTPATRSSHLRRRERCDGEKGDLSLRSTPVDSRMSPREGESVSGGDGRKRDGGDG